MKKVLALCLTLVMVIAMSVPAFAGPGGFVSSPSGSSAPDLYEYSNTDHNCTATLVITAYADRHTLDDETREELEAAYTEIANSTDITTLNADLAKLAKDMGIDGKKLAVSDLFDVSYYSCPSHSEHGAFHITIKPETLQNFAGLLHRNGDSWELLEAKVDGELLTFVVEDLSPFAIVVDTSAGSPVTGDFSNVGFYVAAMTVSAAALVVIVCMLAKKRETN